MRFSALFVCAWMTLTSCASWQGPQSGAAREGVTGQSIERADHQASFAATGARGYARLVDTRRGSHTFFDADPSISYGNTFPAVAMPFGFQFVTPITNGDTAGWLYDFQKTQLSGISISHQPSHWMGDYGMLQLWPMLGTTEAAPAQRAASFSHAQEHATPFSYDVTLDNGIHIEVATAHHASLMSFSFPEHKKPTVLLDAIQTSTGNIIVDAPEQTFYGSVTSDTNHGGIQTLYVYGTFAGGKVDGVTTPRGRDVSTAVSFAAKQNTTIVVSLGTSWLSVEQAHENLQQELHEQTIASLQSACEAAWDKELSRIEINADAAQKTIFYGNLHRTFLYPNLRSEKHNGAWTYKSPYNLETVQGEAWVNNGFWDTYRALWPLLTLLRPQETGKMVAGFAHAVQEGGFTPRWSSPGYADLMPGTSSDAVFADAYVKGIRNFDAQAVYEAAKKNAVVASPYAPEKGRRGLERSMYLGYVPGDLYRESVAWHVEGCSNDAALARFAEALGKTDEATYLRNRSLSYINLFSPSVGFFRGRQADGNWTVPDAAFDPHDWSHEFTEGDAWHYAFAAPFDALGLVHLYGGNGMLTQKIDAMRAAPKESNTTYYKKIIHEMREAALIDEGQYGHSNETVHHIPYLYLYDGRPDRAQHLIRKITDPHRGPYTLGVEDGKGWLGDEDNGAMSAWYIFSTLGLYPAPGATKEYLLGSPSYKQATLHLSDNKTFVVLSHDNGPDAVYVQKVMLNGERHDKTYIAHEDIVAGGTLEFFMGPAPSAWGMEPQARPQSLTAAGAAPRPMVDVSTKALAASGERACSAQEDVHALTDDNALTAYCAQGTTASVVFSFGAGRKYDLPMYTMTSSGSTPLDDPMAWTVDGSNDGVHWTRIDEQSGQRFVHRHALSVYAPKSEKKYAYVRFFLQGSKNAKAVRLAEVELFATP